MRLSPVYYSHEDLYNMRVLDICTKYARLPGEAVLHELCCKRVGRHQCLPRHAWALSSLQAGLSTRLC